MRELAAAGLKLGQRQRLLNELKRQATPPSQPTSREDEDDIWDMLR